MLAEIELTEDNHIAVMEALVARSQVYLPSTPSSLETGMKIYRARTHKKSTDRFRTRRELSYHPDFQSVKLGRANLRKQPIFYGAVAAKEMSQPWAIANLEVSTFPPPKVQTFTTSVWEVVKPIEIMPLVPLKKQAGRMEIAMELHTALWDQIAAVPEDHRERTIELLTILGEEFSKEVTDDKEYLLSAAFAHLIYSAGFGGIAYPSVRSDFRCFNVAIVPEVVNTHMKLVGAQVTQMQSIFCPKHRCHELVTPHYELMRAECDPPFQYVAAPFDLAYHPHTGEYIPWREH